MVIPMVFFHDWVDVVVCLVVVLGIILGILKIAWFLLCEYWYVILGIVVVGILLAIVGAAMSNNDN